MDDTPATATDAQALATTSEAARALGLNPRSLLRWGTNGTVKPTLRTPGGHLRWDVAELREQLRALGAVR